MLTSLKSCRSPCTWLSPITMLQWETAIFYPSRDVATHHPIRQIWIRWTTASGVSFRRGSTVLGFMMWRSWKNVGWASRGCWTTPSSPQRWRSRLNAWVCVNGGHCEHKFRACDFLLCFVCFIDTGFRNVIDINVQSANIVWNVLLLCLTLSHGMVATQRTCGRKFLRQWLWHSLVKWCQKNYENPSIFVKVTVKKSVAPFYLDTV